MPAARFTNPLRHAAPLLLGLFLAGCAVAEPPASPAGVPAANVTATHLRAISTTALTVASAVNESGSAVTLQASIDGPSGVAPSGSVVFTVEGKRIGEATVKKGTASLTVTALPAGLSSLSADYKGDDNLLPSHSKTVRFYNED